jgi:hypothetical protein
MFSGAVVCHRKTSVRFVALFAVLLAGLAGGCTPTVKVATDEPITINLNVNIKHEILIKVDKELDDLFSDDSDIF